MEGESRRLCQGLGWCLPYSALKNHIIYIIKKWGKEHRHHCLPSAFLLKEAEKRGSHGNGRQLKAMDGRASRKNDS